MYCKLGNFLEGFSFVKIISSQNVKISLSLTDVGKANLKHGKYVLYVFQMENMSKFNTSQK